MKKNNIFFTKKVIISTNIISFLSILILPFSALAIGQVTKPIFIENALRGEEFQETLNIVNTDKEDIEVGLSARGEIAGWTKFYKPEDLNNPVQNISMSASEKTNIFVVFAIPKDAPNGTYQGFVSVTQKPKALDSEEGSAVSIAQRIDREATIIVSDKEIISIKASIIPQKYDVGKNEPLIIRVIYDNQGNISVTPQIQIKIKKDSQTVYSVIYPYPENEPSVKPLTMHEIPALEIPTSGLSDGQYLAEITVFQGAQKVFENNFSFSIGKVSANPNGVAAVGEFFGKIMINWYVAGIGLGIFLIGLIVSLLNKNSRIRKIF